MQTNQKELTYKTIEKEILRRINAGVYVPGGQLPTERELEKELGASRLTIAKGLANLVSSGYITRTQGRGSFVCEELPRRSELRHGKSGSGIVKFISPGLPEQTAVRHGVLEGLYTITSSTDRHVGIEFYTTLEQQLVALRSYSDQINEGMVIWPALDSRLLPQLKKMQDDRFPFVLVDVFLPELNCDYIISDNCLGAETMINHLIACGHRKISYFSATPDRVSLSERLAGVISALSKNGVPITAGTISVIPCGDSVVSSLKSAQNTIYLRTRLQELLGSADAPTAIFASNDWIAMAIYNILEELGVKVPEDISIAGFDNIDASQYFKIPLTTMAQKFYEIGCLAGKVITARLERTSSGSDMLFQNRVVPELIIRKSVRNLNKLKSRNLGERGYAPLTELPADQLEEVLVN